MKARLTERLELEKARSRKNRQAAGMHAKAATKAVPNKLGKYEKSHGGPCSYIPGIRARYVDVTPSNAAHRIIRLTLIANSLGVSHFQYDEHLLLRPVAMAEANLPIF